MGNMIKNNLIFNLRKMKVIHYKNLPVKLPIYQSICTFTILHYWNAPGWAYGVFFTYYTLAFIVALMELFTQEYINLNDK